MSTYILTSMFPNGFDEKIAERLAQIIVKREKFAFVASEFEKMHEISDKYFKFFLNMFEEKGICFEESYVVDGRMTPTEAQVAVAKADMVWLSGGDTPTQFWYFKQYGLDDIIKRHNGVIIGMSAGSINLAKTAICTVTCEHEKQEVYEALGCVNFSVEPHFNRESVTSELIELSKEYIIYGLCDDSIILCTEGNVEYIGEVYKLSGGNVERI